MSNLFVILLGWIVGLAVIGWPLMQVFFSLIVGWPISKRFERIGGIAEGSKPSRRYFIGGIINLLILVGLVFLILLYSPTHFLYGAIVGTVIILFKMIFGIRQAAMEVYRELQGDLNEYGKFVAQEDFSNHGIQQ